MINNLLSLDGNINKIFQKDFIWVAEYLNGSLQLEYSSENGVIQQNSFFDIDKPNLLRFGYVGHGMNLYFETINGIMKINGNDYRFRYVDENNVEYDFCNQNNVIYNEIIQFKHSASTFNPAYGSAQERIEAYNIGFKGNYVINGKEFYFKSIIKIPFNKPVTIEYRIVSKEEIKGTIYIIKNDFQKFDYPANLNVDEALDLSWAVR